MFPLLQQRTPSQRLHQEKPNTYTPSTANARVTDTPKEKPKSSSSKEEAPPAYDEEQVAGYIRAMTIKQKEKLLTKVASKGKGQQVVDDHESDSDKDF
jgi:hypothetical protein